MATTYNIVDGAPPVNQANVVDRHRVYLAAGAISGCGALMFNVMPVFVGALASEARLSETQLGDIVAAFNIGFTLIAVSFSLLLTRVDWRLTSLTAVSVTVTALLVMPYAPGFGAMTLLILIAGMGMGALYALVMVILGHSEQPDRAYGLKLGLETLPGALLLFALPALVVPRAGFTGAAVTMALTVLLLGSVSFLLPPRAHAAESVSATESDAKVSRYRLLPLMALASTMAFFTGISATWAFLELIATSQGLTNDSVGIALALAFVICGSGGFIAALLGDRLGRLAPFLCITLVNWLGLWVLFRFTSAVWYGVGACLFLFTVNFALTYTFALTANFDRSGTFTSLSAACLSSGAIVGPAFAGRVLAVGGFESILLFSAICSLLALSFFAVCLIASQRVNQ